MSDHGHKRYPSLPRSSRRIEAEIDEEIRFDIEMRARELVARGLTSEQAHERAVREFGDIEATRQYCASIDRETERVGRWSQRISELRDDLRFACRVLGRRPGVVAAVIATLALGIGVNTAMFSLIDAVILRPLDVLHPEQLVGIYPPARGTSRGRVSLATYQSLAAQTTTLSALAAATGTTVELTDVDPALDVSVSFTTDNYFSLLGVPAAIGHPFTASATGLGADPSVVLSAAFWRRQFGADRGVIGRTIHLNGHALQVVGVASDGFRGTNLAAVPDMWAPVSAIPLLGINLLSMKGALSPNVPFYELIGRLRPGVSSQSATAELDVLMQQAGKPIPSLADSPAVRGSVNVLPLTEAAAGFDRPALVRLLRLVFAVVALTLALACMNVGNILVVRAHERARELGIRTALGASAGRLARQLLTESLILAVGGGVAGLGVAWAVMRVATGFTLPGSIPVDRLGIGLNGRLLAFTALVSGLTAIAFGLAPAIRMTRGDVTSALRQQHGRRPALRGRGPLLSLQVAISLVLLVGAALFLRSIEAGLDTGLGFDPRPLAAVSVQPKFSGRHADNIVPYFAIISQMRATPGVTAVAAGTHVPIGPAVVWPFWKGPQPSSPNDDATPVSAGYVNIAGDYFRTLGVPLLAGRFFTDDDGLKADPVAIVNESTARAFWPAESPIGKQLHARFFTATVVGVVRDTKYGSLSETGRPFVYVPIAQQDFFSPVSFIVRSPDPGAALVALRRTVTTIAPDLKLPTAAAYRPRLVSDQIATVQAPQRFGATLLSAFAIVALCVSAIGIYGTIAYAVARRAAEIGIRIALGAQRSAVLKLILGQSTAAVVAGIGVGVVAAAFASRLIAHFLFGIAPSDWVAFTVATLTVLATAVAAALVPSSRAVRVDPTEALRSD